MVEAVNQVFVQIAKKHITETMVKCIGKHTLELENENISCL